MMGPFVRIALQVWAALCVKVRGIYLRQTGRNQQPFSKSRPYSGFFLCDHQQHSRGRL
ncbi:hypothetical protein KSP40_PGU007027 [Platanthera guangdongensis]|uniref:Secreted protein n=1 Tax=Platanthera guangdongensis TaxID=2320717 RepID=A0ABR2M7N2_9ASPA